MNPFKFVQAFWQHDRWRARIGIALIMFGPVYVLPSVIRTLLAGWWGYWIGILVIDLFGSLVVGLLTNNYRFAAAVCLGASVIELLIVFAGHQAKMALWIGNLIPALVAIYYAQQLYINMGD